MIGSEFAKNPHRSKNPRRDPRDIENVPVFRRHLERNGLRSLDEWEARNTMSASRSTDMDAEHLALRARYVALKAAKR